MAAIKAHVLTDVIQRKLLARLRSLKVARPAQVAEDMASQIMDDIPIEAFEQRDPSEYGFLFFHGDVEEKSVIKAQQEILETHLNIDKKIPLTLYLSTLGGDVFAGLALCSTIQEVRRSGRKVNVHIQGCAMSMGSLIAQACDHRSIDPHAWFMVHEIRHWLSSSGEKTSAFRDEVEFAEKLEQQTFTLYSARTGKPVTYWRKKMHRKDLFLTAFQALDEQLVDEIKTIPPYVRRRRSRKETEVQ